jgi:hypothetical protein
MNSNDRPSIWSRITSPICLILALVCLFFAFALLARGNPEPGMALHRARIGDNHEHQQRLEGALSKDRWIRRMMIGGLFASSGAFIIAGFLTLNPARSDE